MIDAKDEEEITPVVDDIIYFGDQHQENGIISMNQF